MLVEKVSKKCDAKKLLQTASERKTAWKGSSKSVVQRSGLKHCLKIAIRKKSVTKCPFEKEFDLFDP